MHHIAQPKHAYVLDEYEGETLRPLDVEYVRPDENDYSACGYNQDVNKAFYGQSEVGL